MGAIIVWGLVLAVYFLPAFVGHKKRAAAAIFVLNFFLGWTFVGWVVALVWACLPETNGPVERSGVAPGQPYL